MTLETLRSAFAPTRGYLNAATCGLPTASTVEAMGAAIAAWRSGRPDVAAYDEAVAASRSAFARVVGVPSSEVAIGATTAGLVALVAASLPAGAEVLTAVGDFTSVTYPFLARADLVVHAVPVAHLAGAIGPRTAAVAFSLVQSKDGTLADLDAISTAAREAGALTLVDLTQAAGWLPVDAGRVDVTVTAAYKWLCAPRGTAFLTAGPELRERLRPIHANWYGGEDVWGSVYGHDMRLARDTRRFDTSPAWLCWVGAAPALEAFADELAGPHPHAIHRHDAALADALRDLAPRAPHQDAFGRDRYALWSTHFIGATVDLDETYAWGVEQLAAITAEQTAIAHRIAGPGATVEEAIATLEADPARKLRGTEALQHWMQTTADAAIAELHGRHFMIAAPLHRIECRIAPTQTGGIYYTGPSDDLSRPGRMWWSVPPGVEEFSTWRERTTVYHEGVPGHHLQVGTAVVNRDELNDFRRLAMWTSGHGEGWALYAERLMADLGFLDDDGDRLGMLDGQRMRATRVVFDIGVHLGLPAPAQYGGGTWDADKGWQLMKDNVHMAEGFNRFEWLRYLGWAGQAPSYLVGQRLWLEIRDAARAAAEARGEAFDLAAFHARALNLGSLPLEVLAKVV